MLYVRSSSVYSSADGNELYVMYNVTDAQRCGLINAGKRLTKDILTPRTILPWDTSKAFAQIC